VGNHRSIDDDNDDAETELFFRRRRRRRRRVDRPRVHRCIVAYLTRLAWQQGKDHGTDRSVSFSHVRVSSRTVSHQSGSTQDKYTQGVGVHDKIRWYRL
jgi:hypothetical protein